MNKRMNKLPTLITIPLTEAFTVCIILLSFGFLAGVLAISFVCE